MFISQLLALVENTLSFKHSLSAREWIKAMSLPSMQLPYPFVVLRPLTLERPSEATRSKPIL